MEDHISFLVLFFSFVVVILMTLKAQRKLKRNYSATKLPPGPRRLPLVGNMHHMIGSLPHRRLADLSKEYGNIMLIQLGEVSNIVISSAEAAKDVLKTHDIIFAQRPSTLAAQVMFYNLTDIAFGPYGEYWRQLRKICTLELFTMNRVRSFRKVREEEVLNLVSTILSKEGSVINLSQLVFCLINDIVARAIFGEKCRDQEALKPFVTAIAQIFGGFSLSDIFPSVKLIPTITGFKSRLLRLSQEADGLMEDIIDNRRAIGESTEFSPNREEALLDVLLKLQESRDLEFPLTTDNIKAVILDMFVAGTETSSTTIEWTMSELMKNPEIMKKAQAEVRNVFKGKRNADETGLDELKYLKSIIKETLRLHPPAPLLLPREARQRCELNGYEIPEKMRVIINTFAIGRDPSYWSEPEKFYPERFLDSSIDYKGTNLQYLPFGAGRRMCPGMLFGIANVELPLAQLLYCFDWKLPEGQTEESLDMFESFGSAVGRKNHLHLIPVPHIL